MKKWIALLLALLMIGALSIGALAEVDLDAAELDAEEGDYADDDSEWLFEDDEDLVDDELAIAELLQGDDGAPITQINESDQEDLSGAMEVYSWFAMQPLDIDEAFPSPDGALYRVLDERFNTPELMKNMLSFYFSDEIVSELWNSSVNPYVEIDGFLYTDGEGRDIDPNIGEVSVEVAEKTDDLIKLTATIEYLEPEDGKSAETFEYERRFLDGEWKYTVFPFYW